MNKKGFIDMEIIFSPAFVILTIFAWSATIIGWVASKRMELGASFSVPEIIFILLAELIAVYLITLRMS